MNPMEVQLRAAIDRLARLERENQEIKRQLLAAEQSLRDARGN